MRIFHLGLCVGPPPFDSMRKAFIANCDDYIELSTGEKDVNQEAVRIAREFRPDIIFMQIQAYKQSRLCEKQAHGFVTGTAI
jgi:hypothetical protein